LLTLRLEKGGKDQHIILIRLDDQDFIAELEDDFHHCVIVCSARAELQYFLHTSLKIRRLSDSATQSYHIL